MALIETLTDDFTTKDVSKWTWGGTSSVVSGQANFIPLTTYANGIASAATWTLTGSSAIVQVVQASPTGTTGTLENWFEIDSGASSPPMVLWRKLGANMVAAWRNAGGTETDLATFAYNSSTHAWWRIRESGGTTFWDTSSDGITWTNRASLANPFTYTSAFSANLGAGYSGTEATPGTFIIDNFNLSPSSSSNDPGTIASLTHRWVASDLALTNGATVSTWAPRTSAVTLTGNASPTYVVSSNVGGRPAVRLNGTTQYFSATVSSATFGTLAAIINITSIAAQQEIVQLQGTGDNELLTSGSSQFQNWTGSAVNSGTVTAGSYVLAAGSDATTADYICVNGTQTAGSAGTPAAVTGLAVGRNQGTSTRFLGGDVAEVLLFSAKLTTLELSVLDSYAQDTYGITVADYVSSAHPQPPLFNLKARMRASDW